MKIVNVCRRFDPAHWGGTETVVIETGRRLQDRGHDVSILASAALGAPSSLRVAGIATQRYAYHYPYLGLKAVARANLDNAGGNLISWPLLGRLLTIPKPDVVHLHTAGRLGGMVRWACRRRGIPYVVSLHGGCYTLPAGQRALFADPLQGTLDWGKAIGFAFGARRVLRDAAAVLAVSAAEARACRAALPGQRVVHTPHGVDPAAWSSPAEASGGFPSDASVRLLCVARLDPQKGQEDLLAATKLLAEQFPRVHLQLIGSATSPDYADRLRRLATAPPLAGRVTFRGGLEPGGAELRAAFRDADCVVIPSRHEPFGIVALEAWASERPLVATEVGGLAELIQDGISGRLVPAGSPQALAAAISELALRPEIAARLAKAGRAEVAARFTWTRAVDRLEQLYASLQRTRTHRQLTSA